MTPKPGEVVYVDARASVQFAGDRALILRVTAVPSWPTYTGWIWLRGYVLTPLGEAVEQREIFGQLAGVRRIPPRRQVAARVTGSAVRSTAGPTDAPKPKPKPKPKPEPKPNGIPAAASRPASDRRTPVGRFRNGDPGSSW